MARPTKLTPEILEQTKTYIEGCTSDWETTTKPYTDSEGNLKEKQEVRYNVNLPTIEGLSYELGIHKDTVYDWRKGEGELHIEFSDLIGKLLAKQAKYLINKGLSGEYNPTIAKVLLTKHGYSDKQEIDVTTKGDKLTNVDPKLHALAQEFEKKLKEEL